jgi:hypothetical protein
MIFEDVHWIDPTSLEALGRGKALPKCRGAFDALPVSRFEAAALLLAGVGVLAFSQA